MEVVAARHPQSLGQDAEMDAVNLLSIDDGVHGSMYVKQQAVFSSIPSQGRVGRESTGDVVMHYDGHAKHLSGLGSVQHALARPGSGIQVVTLDLTCLGLGFVDSFCHEEESIAPPHKRLRVNVLVILREVKPASQTLIHSAQGLQQSTGRRRSSSRSARRALNPKTFPTMEVKMLVTEPSSKRSRG